MVEGAYCCRAAARFDHHCLKGEKGGRMSCEGGNDGICSQLSCAGGREGVIGKEKEVNGKFVRVADGRSSVGVHRVPC
jgi:hypothetical protein